MRSKCSDMDNSVHTDPLEYRRWISSNKACNVPRCATPSETRSGASGTASSRAQLDTTRKATWGAPYLTLRGPRLFGVCVEG